VAQVAPRYVPAIGGVERHVEGTSRELARRGVEVEVITTDPTGELPRVEQRDGVLVRRFPTIAGDSTYYLAPELVLWLRRNAGRFDLLHGHSYHTPIALQTGLIAHARKQPFVVTSYYHGSGHSRFRTALHVPYKAFGSWMLRHADLVVCISGAEKALLAEHFGLNGSAMVIPSGIDPDEIAAAKPHAKPGGQVLLLAVSRLEEYKRLPLLVQALRHLPENYHLLIVGQGPDEPAIREAAAGIEQRLTLTGGLSREDLLGWFRTADVFVSLSTKESFGLVLAEAAAAGCALLASDIPAHRDVAGFMPGTKVGFVPLEAGPEAIAKVVLRAGGRRDERADVPTWQRHVDGLLPIYELLTGRSAACAS